MENENDGKEVKCGCDCKVVHDVYLLLMSLLSKIFVTISSAL